MSKKSNQCLIFPNPLRHEVAKSLISSGGRILSQRLRPLTLYPCCHLSPTFNIPPPSNSSGVMVSDILLSPSTYTTTTPVIPENVTQKWCHLLSSMRGRDKILQLKQTKSNADVSCYSVLMVLRVFVFFFQTNLNQDIFLYWPCPFCALSDRSLTQARGPVYKTPQGFSAPRSIFQLRVFRMLLVGFVLTRSYVFFDLVRPCNVSTSSLSK